MKKRPKHISKEDWDAVDSPPLTDEQLARMRPATEVVPEIVTAYRRSRGAQKAPLKVKTSIRLDADIVEHFKRQGRGWQSRVNAELRKLVPD